MALSFVGEAFFVASFVSSIAWLASKDTARRASLDRITCTAIAAGYPVLTAGALVTWLVCTFNLHYRRIRRKTGAVPAWISVIGFACTLFTFFGVNFLLSGLHSCG